MDRLSNFSYILLNIIFLIIAYASAFMLIIAHIAFMHLGLIAVGVVVAIIAIVFAVASTIFFIDNLRYT